MTSELRPALEVWDLLWDAFTGTPPQSGNPNAPFEAAAAVIEADREAVRAEQAAEVADARAAKEELRRLMDIIWRAEYMKDAPQWRPLDDLVGMVTQIDNMYAGVRGQRDQAQWELAKFKALAETLAGAVTEAREALHFHYVEWDGEPEDAVPLQLARSKCDAALTSYKEQRDA